MTKILQNEDIEIPKPDYKQCECCLRQAIMLIDGLCNRCKRISAHNEGDGPTVLI